jgi:uncharacterized protein
MSGTGSIAWNPSDAAGISNEVPDVSPRDPSFIEPTTESRRLLMFTVDISSLSTGIHHLEFAPSATDVDLDPTTFEDVRVEAELQYHMDRILVKVDARATAELTCDRTLQSYDQPVSGHYSLLFGPPEMVGQEGDEFEEVRPLDPTDQEIDLTDVVRDTILLALPQRRVAPGAEEEPIEREFGTPEDEEQDAIDPRWSELRKLRDDDSS